MKTITKAHPLREIILDFDLSKQAPDFEVEALDAYYTMHDQTWETKQNLFEHKDRLFDLDIQITELEYLLLPLEQKIIFLEMALKLTKGVELPPMNKLEFPVSEGSFSIDVGQFFEEVEQHCEAMAALHPSLLAEWTWLDKWADFIYEHEDWCIPDKSDLIHQVFRRYEEVSVDIVSLDRDQQEFFGAHGEVRKLQNEYFEYGDQIFGMYNRVKERAEKAYRRAERIYEHSKEDFEA